MPEVAGAEFAPAEFAVVAVGARCVDVAAAGEPDDVAPVVSAQCAVAPGVVAGLAEQLRLASAAPAVVRPTSPVF